MKKGIIVASFGTTYEKTRRLCIESIEKRITEEYREFSVLRAFTSRMVISRLKEKDNLHVLNESEAIEQLRNAGIDDIYIQPLHIIKGHEYEKLTRYSLPVGAPLLDEKEDYIKIVKDKDINDMGTEDALVFMGHGSDHNADTSYDVLENTYREQGIENIFIATVEGRRTIEGVIDKLKKRNAKKIKLKPFMLVAGDHALNDMASDDEDSWKSILENQGFQVDICLRGLGEYDTIHQIFLEHLNKILGA